MDVRKRIGIDSSRLEHTVCGSLVHPGAAAERSRPAVGYRSLLAALTVSALGLGIWSSASEAQPKSNTTYTYYTVSGKTAGEIFNAMLRQGPKVNGMKSFASTSMTTLQKGYLEPGKSCQIKGYALQLNFVTKLPRVANEKALPAADLTRWRQFSQMVKIHEATHRSIWLDCAASVERQTKAIKASSCSEFNQKVERIWQTARAACTQRHASFERSEYARMIKHPFARVVARKDMKTRAAALR